jgi:3-hydroxybutyryl-CoA dehydrogenase
VTSEQELDALAELAVDKLGRLDIWVNNAGVLYEEFKQTEYAPPPLLKRMVASGRIGRKAGRGFYEYGRQTAETVAR